MIQPSRRTLCITALLTLGLAFTGCAGNSNKSASTATTNTTMQMDMAVGANNGLSAAKDGYTLVVDNKTLEPGKQTDFTFHITSPDGKVQTSFADDQTKLMHFYVIRSDATGYQHLHPTQGTGAKAGQWSVPLKIDKPGSYRVYTSFIATDAANKEHELVLSEPVTVTGSAPNTPLPPASDTATVDGYAVKLSGDAMAGMEHMLTATITKDGKPVTDLEKYLDTWAHLTAFKADNLAIIHIHPNDTTSTTNGGPTLHFMADFPATGAYRAFMQFQTGGQLHTAEFTIEASN